MSLRVEVAMRITSLDGTSVVEATGTSMAQYGGESFTGEVLAASPLFQEEVERVRKEADRQIATLLTLADEADRE